MSKQHEELKLFRGPITGEWMAVKVDSDNIITDKWPLTGVEELIASIKAAAMRESSDE